MSGTEIVQAGMLLVRAEEAWEPVLLGGLIPIFGALAVFYIIWRAVRDNPEDDADAGPDPADGEPGEGEDAAAQRPPSRPT